jgi:hypothetical protein
MIARTQEGCSFFQLCAPTTVVSTSPSRPLWPGPPRSARPSSPRHLHHPAITIAQLTTGVRRGASPAPRRGAAAFNNALRQSSSPRRPRAGSAALHGARWPLACFTALLFPSSHSSRLFAVEHHPHPGWVQLLSTMCSDHHPCASTTIVSTSPSRPLWSGPPRCASPSSPRRLHHPAIAIAQLTTGVRGGASPAPGGGATFFHPCVSTTIVSTSPSGRVRRAPRVPLPLVAFTTLLSPSHRPPRVFTKEYHHECSARSLHQPCPAPSTPGPSTQPCSYNLDIGPSPPRSSFLNTGTGPSLLPSSCYQGQGIGTSPPHGYQRLNACAHLCPTLLQRFLKPGWFSPLFSPPSFLDTGPSRLSSYNPQQCQTR